MEIKGGTSTTLSQPIISAVEELETPNSKGEGVAERLACAFQALPELQPLLCRSDR